jgi:hypothetical protein
MRDISESLHRGRERKYMKGQQQQAQDDAAVQSAILQELRAMNQQLAWLCQAVSARQRAGRW